MERSFDWVCFNTELIRSTCSEEFILAYDPSYLCKIGKQTPNVERFWSGQAQAVKRGIEIGSLAVIDITNGTAY
ncbi:MAG: hypothetical protein IPH84_10495 [Bacteroidales bacterium]|nr:hypothetical protein [Bacteroidales bacterium]